MAEVKKTIRPFVPRPGQVDMRKQKWCPCIVAVLTCGDEFLMLQRSDEVSAYQGLWSGVAGFLDSDLSLEEIVLKEVQEETFISSRDVVSIELKKIFHNPAPELNKVFIIHAVLVHVLTKFVRTDWEAKDFCWLRTESEAMGFPLAPGFGRVLMETVFAH